MPRLQGRVIKEYFLSYNEALSNDFVLSNGGRDVELLGPDISDWRITFVDTGAQSTIGERLRPVASHLGDDEFFLATYGDDLTDAPLPEMIGRLKESGKTGIFLSTGPMSRPTSSRRAPTAWSRRIDSIQEADVWINAGFFVFRRNILDYISPARSSSRSPSSA